MRPNRWPRWHAAILGMVALGLLGACSGSDADLSASDGHTDDGFVPSASAQTTDAPSDNDAPADNGSQPPSSSTEAAVEKLRAEYDDVSPSPATGDFGDEGVVHVDEGSQRVTVYVFADDDAAATGFDQIADFHGDGSYAAREDNYVVVAEWSDDVGERVAMVLRTLVS